MIAYLADASVLEDEELYRRAFSLLGGETQTMINRYRFESDRRLETASQLLLRYGLACEWGRPPGEPALRFGVRGKPYLLDDPDLFFNISHSGRYALCAFDSREIGADVQEIRPVKDSVFKYALNPSEKEELSSSENMLDDFFSLWALKESVMKFTGLGLGLPLKAFSVSLDGDVTWHTDVSYSCRVKLLPAPEGYRMAVCTAPETQPAEPEMIELTSIISGGTFHGE